MSHNPSWPYWLISASSKHRPTHHTCHANHTAFGTEFTFNFRPQPPPKYFKHRLPTNQNLILTLTIIIAQPTSHRIRLSCWSPYAETSFFEDPSNIEMDDLSSQNSPFRSRNPLGLFDPLSNTHCAPVKEKFLLFHSWHSTTIPLLLIFLSTLSSLHDYNPSHRIIWGRHFRDRNRYKICRHRGPRSPVYWIHLPDG